MKFTDAIKAAGRPFCVYPGIVQKVGSLNAGVFLCLLLWKTYEDSDGWLELSADEIRAETTLTSDQQRAVRNTLTNQGLMEEKYKRLEHKMFYRLHVDAICALFDDGGAPCKIQVREVGKSKQAPCKIQVREVGKSKVAYKGKVKIEKNRGEQPPQAPVASSKSTLDFPSSDGPKSLQDGLSLPLTLQSEESRSDSIPDKVSTPSAWPVEPKKGKEIPLTRQFTDAWMLEWKKAKGTDYTGFVIAGAKEGAATARILKTGIPVTELIAIARKAWARPENWDCKQACTIAGFVARFEAIRSIVATRPGAGKTYVSEATKSLLSTLKFEEFDPEKHNPK